MNKEDQIGVIVEQGFVAGNGLGFNPVSINENKKDADNDEEKQS